MTYIGDSRPKRRGKPSSIEQLASFLNLSLSSCFNVRLTTVRPTWEVLFDLVNRHFICHLLICRYQLLRQRARTLNRLEMSLLLELSLSLKVFVTT